LIELLLLPLAFLVALEIFELFLALRRFGFLFLARFGLLLQYLFDLVGGSRRVRSEQYNKKRAGGGCCNESHTIIKAN
jgi:hypothetical protein